MDEPWKRLKAKGETSQAYGAFCVYRDLGPRRSIAKACREHHPEPSAAKLRQMETWSARFDWVERCAAWDDEQDRVRRESQLKHIRDMSERHANLAVLFQQKVLERLGTLDLEQMTPHAVATWLDTAVRIERQARGEPGDIVAQQVQGELGIEVKEVMVTTREEANAVLSALSGANPLPGQPGPV